MEREKNLPNLLLFSLINWGSYLSKYQKELEAIVVLPISLRQNNFIVYNSFKIKLMHTDSPVILVLHVHKRVEHIINEYRDLNGILVFVYAYLIYLPKPYVFCLKF